jgi:hypothetical protein
VPVKDADLKNFDSYKRAIRADLPRIAAGNCKFFLFKDVELPNAQGKKQKYPAFLILVDDAGAHQGLAGKKPFCKGICGIREEKIAFEPHTGKVPYKQLKVSIPLLLGKAVWIPEGREDDEGGEEGSLPAALPHAATPSEPPSELAAAWNKLFQDARAYAAAHPGHADALKHAAAEIQALLTSNQTAEAHQRMERLRAFLSAPPKAAAPADAHEQATARWNALVKQLQAEAARNPAAKAGLVRATAGIADMIKVGKLDLANQLMDRAHAMLQGTPPDGQQTTAAGAEKTPETGNRAPSDLVRKRRFLLERWQKIPPRINNDLKALKDAIARELPREDAEELMALSEDYLDDFYDEMKDAIDDDINVGDLQHRKAIATIEAFRDKIATEPLIQHLKKNALKANVTVESILLDALSEVEQTLAS